jgi:hypothetical protein
MPKQKISHVTPGLFAIGDRVRPIHDGEFRLYGYGKIVAIKTTGNPYEVKFHRMLMNLAYREDEIRK